VRKGEKGTRICFYKTLNKEETNDEGEAKTRKMFFLRTYTVFNLDQVDSTQEGDKDRLANFRPAPDDESKPAPFTDWQPAEELCESTGADIRHLSGNRACYYRPTPIGSFPNHSDGDWIQLPMRYQFPDLADYYGTKLHELVHWTEIRREWDGSYAMGELIAEIGGCYLATALNIPQSDDLENHSRYLASWLKAMDNDPKWIFKASQEASKAADFILSFSEQEVEKPEPVSVA
jgi:antirestriction protein ArdC